jgi:small subunit ribosomal protein S1
MDHDAMNLAQQTESESTTPAAGPDAPQPGSAPSHSPAPSAPDAAPAAEVPDAGSTTGGATESGNKPRIAIGSQRERFQPRVTPKPGFDPQQVRQAPTAPPTAKQTPAPAAQETHAPAPAAPAASTSETAASVAMAPKTATAADASPATEPSATTIIPSATPASPAAAQPSEPEEPAGRRGRRDRRQREAVPEERVAHTVDVPNLRRGLTPEQQAEFDEALAGVEFDSLLGAPAATSRAGELAPDTQLVGRIVGVHRDSVFVDVGRQHQGIVPLRQFEEPPAVGTDLEVVVSRFDADEGLYTLSVPGGSVSIGDWSQVSEGLVVDARITGHNKGGLECEVSQLRGFIPASQVALYRVEDFSQFVGEKKEASREQLLAELAPGQTREGVVRSLQPFGAFVDLGGVDGLIHVSQISWTRVNHPNEVLELGQHVQVRILKIDPETHKIALGLKDLQDNPWNQATSKFPPRSTVHGRVTKLMEFGAFVEIEPGIEGLVHISELDHKRVFRVSDVLQVGQEVDAQILNVDVESRRISLSIKALKAMAAPLKVEEPEVEAPPETAAQRAAREKAYAKLKGGRAKSSGGEQFGLKW